jgi:hypothetical protein
MHRVTLDAQVHRVRAHPCARRGIAAALDRRDGKLPQPKRAREPAEVARRIAFDVGAGEPLLE